MDQRFVITIARGYGSGGKTIGRMLAEELGIHYYDRELLRLASEDSGISEAIFAGADENFKRTSLFKTARGVYTGEVIPPDSEDFISNENLFNFQAKIIRKLAETESCVIIGRCADYVLRDMEHVLRVFVHAPFEDCVKSACKLHPALSDDDMRRFILKTDKRRANYYTYFTGRDWKDADNYDLCINSSDLNWEKCVALVKSYLNIKLGD